MKSVIPQLLLLFIATVINPNYAINNDKAAPSSVPTATATTDHPEIFKEISDNDRVDFSEYHGKAVEIDDGNFDAIRHQSETLLLNFYAEWCPFSKMLMPIWEEAAREAAEMWPTPSHVVFGKVHSETNINKIFKVSKYPTIKIILFGRAIKQEYRGRRRAKDLLDFVSQLINETISYIQEDLISRELGSKVKDKKPAIIRYSSGMPGPQSALWVFKKISKVYQRECLFMWAAKNLTEGDGCWETDRVIFQPLSTATTHDMPNEADNQFRGKLNDYVAFIKWVNLKCNPLIREVTFDNAEEIIEEGYPMLIMLTNGDDHNSIRAFKKAVDDELDKDLYSGLNILHGDGNKFKYPLQRIDKTVKDLPIIFIDDLKHMYPFPNFNELQTPNKLKSFVTALHNGSLHHNYHAGWSDEFQQLFNIIQQVASEETIEAINLTELNLPDNMKGIEKESVEIKQIMSADNSAPKSENQTITTDDQGLTVAPSSSPTRAKLIRPPPIPESTFSKLAPSSQRYSFRGKDEL